MSPTAPTLRGRAKPSLAECWFATVVSLVLLFLLGTVGSHAQPAPPRGAPPLFNAPGRPGRDRPGPQGDVYNYVPLVRGGPK